MWKSTEVARASGAARLACGGIKRKPSTLRNLSLRKLTSTPHSDLFDRARLARWGNSAVFSVEGRIDSAFIAKVSGALFGHPCDSHTVFSMVSIKRLRQ